MSDGEIRSRKLRLYEPLMCFESLIELVSKCFVCRFRKHAERKWLVSMKSDVLEEN